MGSFNPNASFANEGIKMRPEEQSNDEWVKDFEGRENKGRPKKIQAPHHTSIKNPESETIAVRIYEVTGYKTNRVSGLTLDLVDVETGEEVVAFFNVDTTYQRGPNRGKHKRIGVNGEFLPKSRSKFRKFWMAVVGEEPRKWAEIHKYMRSRLIGKQIVGVPCEPQIDKRGHEYIKVNNLRPLDGNIR